MQKLPVHCNNNLPLQCTILWGSERWNHWTDSIKEIPNWVSSLPWCASGCFHKKSLPTCICTWTVLPTAMTQSTMQNYLYPLPPQRNQQRNDRKKGDKAKEVTDDKKEARTIQKRRKEGGWHGFGGLYQHCGHPTHPLSSIVHHKVSGGSATILDASWSIRTIGGHGIIWFANRRTVLDSTGAYWQHRPTKPSVC